MTTKSQAPRASDFERMAESARRELAIKAREDLIAAAAHDLRSPLNGIQGWAHVLESRLGGTPPGGNPPGGSALVQRALQGIKSGVEQQVQLIADLTDAVQIMNGAMVMQPQAVSLRLTVRDALDAVNEAAQARGIVFGSDEADALVWADGARLAQALRHVFAHIVRCAMANEQIQVDILSGAGVVTLIVSGPAQPASAIATVKPRMRAASAAIKLADSLLALNSARMQSSALDAEGVRERFEIELVPAALAPGTLQQGALEAHRQSVAARAQAPLGHLRIALVKGVGWEGLLRQLIGLGASPDVLQANEDGEPPYDVAILPGLPAPQAVSALPGVPRLGYGGQGGKSAAREDGTTLAWLAPDVAPLDLAAIVLIASRCK